MFAMYELRMKRPCARDGFTPISSSVRTADDDPEPELGGGGGGDPWRVAGTRCIGGSVCTGAGPMPGGTCAATAAPAGVGGTVCLNPGAATTTAAEAIADAGVGGAVAVTDVPGRRCGSFAIWPSRSPTDCGRSFGSFASTRPSSWSSSSGRFGLMPTADGIGELTVAYATSIRYATPSVISKS